mgnify:CR=1 FL=1
MSKFGRSIRIFLADGSPTGLRHVEIANWTGQALACPRSRFSELSKWEESKGPGVYFLFESSDHRFIMHLGHPEYNSGRLVEEARRDAAAKLDDVAPPKNFDVNKPINTWRSHRNEFFQSWIKYIYLKNEF